MNCMRYSCTQAPGQGSIVVLQMMVHICKVCKGTNLCSLLHSLVSFRCLADEQQVYTSDCGRFIHGKGQAAKPAEVSTQM
jgi:hypothetical protein